MQSEARNKVKALLSKYYNAVADRYTDRRPASDIYADLGNVEDDLVALCTSPEAGAIDEEALGAAAWELQRSFGREGSIYGIKACEEIARLAVATYLRSRPQRLTEEPK